MSPDQQPPPLGDQAAVILARLEANVMRALEDLKAHSTKLDRHDTDIYNLRDRVTVLETLRPKNVAAWVANAVAVVATIAAFIAIYR